MTITNARSRPNSAATTPTIGAEISAWNPSLVAGTIRRTSQTANRHRATLSPTAAIRRNVSGTASRIARSTIRPYRDAARPPAAIRRRRPSPLPHPWKRGSSGYPYDRGVPDDAAALLLPPAFDRAELRHRAIAMRAMADRPASAPVRAGRADAKDPPSQRERWCTSSRRPVAPRGLGPGWDLVRRAARAQLPAPAQRPGL